VRRVAVAAMAGLGPDSYSLNVGATLLSLCHTSAIVPFVLPH
jgi:hypothetical protein